MSDELTPLPKCVPFSGCQEITQGAYFFYVNKSFEVFTTSATSERVCCYVDPRGVEVTVIMQDELALSHLAGLSREVVQWIALEYKDSITKHLKAYAVLRNNSYVKKMNLSDDIAAWSAWELTIRTPTFTVACVFLRRKYIPPLMGTCKDIAVIYRVSAEDMKRSGIKEAEVIRACHFTSDSFSPVSQNHLWYRDMVQGKLDALMFDEDGYSWMQTRFKLRPAITDHISLLLKSVLVMLDEASILGDQDLIRDLSRAPAVEDPLQLVEDLIRAPPGLELLDPEQTTKPRHEWEQRLARYCAFCFDGGLLGQKFTLADLSEAVGLTNNYAVDQMIRRLMAFFLHIRPIDLSLVYEERPLSSMLADSTFASTYSYNHRVFSAFFDIGYVAKLFSKGQELDYVRLMGFLLESRCSPLSIKAAICRRVLQATTNVEQQQPFLALLGPMMGLVRPLSGTYSTFLSTYAMAVLVNLCAYNDEVKTILVNADVASTCVSELKQRSDESAKHACTLAINLTKKDEHRAKFISAGLVPQLVDVLNDHYQEVGVPEKAKLLSHVLAVIGQLINDDNMRDEVCSVYPVLDYALYIFHNAYDWEVKTRATFCLRQLCLHGWQVRQRVGKHCMRPLVKSLQEAESRSYLATVLSLLMQICLYRPNCYDLVNCFVLDALHDVEIEAKEEVIRQRIVALRNKIEQQTKFPYYADHKEPDDKEGEQK
eukprot:GHVU01029996.1.p1 GENE.GHVU01029996.1~~GHVU01029996.1.p1  ORF type:complete len:746 (+),score=170.30 GHVU01029996.1:106-2238(+)